MTTDTEGNPNPHAPRYPSDLPPRRDGTSPAAASPRKRLAMARAILSALAVEAKSCVGRLQRDDLAPHQRNDLARVEEMGGLALVLVELRAEGGALLGRWCAPWSELEARWKVSRRAKPGRAGSSRAEDYVESRSVGPEELAGHEVDAACYLRPFVGG